MDHGGEALIGLAGAHCDTFELLELAEEVLDEMPPFVHLLVEGERLCATRMLGDHGLGAARVEIGDDDVAVERLIGDQRVEGQSLDERRHAHCVEALSRRQITPRAAGSGDPQDRLNKSSVVLAAAAGVAPLAKTKRLHLRPLGVSQNESVHSKLESQSSTDEKS